MYKDISTNNQGQQIQHIPEEPDEICQLLKKEAGRYFSRHKIPSNRRDWENHQHLIYNKILLNAGISFYPELDFHKKVTGRSRLSDYTIQNICFQTLPGVYATANLYIPDGEGPFPAVINFHGHILNSKLDDSVQKRAHILAKNGFACLCMDAFGTGERSIDPLGSDYHGGIDGANHYNNGQSLLGLQVSENMRIVDLLYSLEFIDKNNIGATGESGGGNQAMWLAAIDKRIKAVMPVVSVGTFEAFVMAHNCICETLPGGLTFCEESQVLGLIAPRALNVCNALQEKHLAFSASEMLRTVKNTGKIYRLVNASENFHVQIFNNEHEYSKEMQLAMINWFNSHLKNSGQLTTVNLDIEILNKEELRVINEGCRDTKIISQPEYLHITGLKQLAGKKFSGDRDKEIEELKRILNLNKWEKTACIEEKKLSDSLILKYFQSNSDFKTPVLFKTIKKEPQEVSIYADLNGKENAVSEKTGFTQTGLQISFDLLGTGEMSSPLADFYDNEITPFHTLVRSLIWMNKTVLGEWIKQFRMILDHIRMEKPDARIHIFASKEAGVAALLFSVLHPGIHELSLTDCPISYLYEEKPPEEFFNLSLTLPGIIPWGDLVLAMALSDANITIINPRNLHGKILTNENRTRFLEDYKKLSILYNTRATLFFQ